MNPAASAPSSVGTALQWGRRGDATEWHIPMLVSARVAKRFNGAVAVMRRNDDLQSRPSRPINELQWGRRGDATECMPQVSSCRLGGGFNGAVAVMRRNVAAISALEGFKIGFNGAVAVMRRNASSARAHRCPVPLQWGRRGDATECWLTAEEALAHGRFNGAVAVMRRNAPWGRAVDITQNRFNGAVAVMRRNVVVTTARLAPSSRFNGAVAVMRRNGATQQIAIRGSLSASMGPSR